MRMTLLQLLAKLRTLMLRNAPRTQPHRTRTDKEVERWRNEGGH
jgi:hypothetical protein